MVRPGGIFGSLPVRGLRPIPRFLGLTWKTPNPLSSIRSPFIMESFMASRTASTATSALTFVMSAALETSLMMSTLIMGMDLLLSDTYYRTSRNSASNNSAPHPSHRDRPPPQRGQVVAAQPHRRPSRRDRRPASAVAV